MAGDSGQTLEASAFVLEGAVRLRGDAVFTVVEFPHQHRAGDHLHFDAYLPRLLSTVNDRCHALGYKVLIEAADDQGKGLVAIADKAKFADIADDLLRGQLPSEVSEVLLRSRY